MTRADWSLIVRVQVPLPATTVRSAALSAVITAVNVSSGSMTLSGLALNSTKASIWSTAKLTCAFPSGK